MKWLKRRRLRKNCFHHDRPPWSDGKVLSITYIQESILDYRKRYKCTNCGRIWII